MLSKNIWDLLFFVFLPLRFGRFFLHFLLKTTSPIFEKMRPMEKPAALRCACIFRRSLFTSRSTPSNLQFQIGD